MTIPDMLAFGDHGQAAWSMDGAALAGAGSPTFIRDLSIREDFIEQNPIGPDIRLEGVGAVVGRLWGCPLHWDFSAAAGGINVILKNSGRWVMRGGTMNTAAAFGGLLGLQTGKGDRGATSAVRGAAQWPGVMGGTTASQ